MISWIRPHIEKWQASRKLALAVAADHVELTSTHLVVGLVLHWHNKTSEPITVLEIKVKVYIDGRGNEPLRFYPLERFEHVKTGRGFTKKSVVQFTFSPGEIHTQKLRFISQEILDIPEGNYYADIEIKDTHEKVYTNRAKIHLVAKMKYRSGEEWEDTVE